MHGRPGLGDETGVYHCSSFNLFRPTQPLVKCYVHSRTELNSSLMIFTVPDMSTQSQFDTDNIKVMEGALRSSVCWGGEQSSHQSTCLSFLIVLVSAVQQRGSAVVGIQFSPCPPSPRPSQGTELSSPQQPPLALYFTHRSVCISLHSPSSSLPLLPPALSMHPFSMAESLFLSGR